MSERISSPLLSSPGRTSSISRPGSGAQWPWASPVLLRHNHRSASSTSSHLVQNSWDSRTPGSSSSLSLSSWANLAQRQSTGSTTMTYTPSPEETTRHWQSTAFEWTVRNVLQLRDYLEHDPVDGGPTDADFEILHHSPILGEHKFKLEINRTPIGPESEQGDKPQTLSLYATLMMDFHPEYEMPVTMLTAVRCGQDDRIGGRPEWLWENWHSDFTFRPGSEVWACQLPALSTLLENTRLQETDVMVICLQIHSPVAPTLYAHPSAYYVPKDLLDGLEASLDNSNTGDVRFICLERITSEHSSSPLLQSPELPSPTAQRPPSSVSSQMPFSGQATARKRVIYAHSDILTRRSEYFATMLASSFAENQGHVSGERKICNIVVEEADFETIYWLLKYCYANWLMFKEHDDPRAAVDGIGAGWSARWLNARGGEWDWKTFHRLGAAEEGDSRGSDSAISDHSRSPAPKPVDIDPIPRPSNAPRPSASKVTSSPSASRPAPTNVSRRNPPAPSTHVGIGGNSNTRPKQGVPMPISVSANFAGSGGHYPISPHAPRRPSTFSTLDPHLHPTAAPAPASALSMYQVAHRYGMPALAQLALEHMMGTITPQSSFALLLATSVWDDLRSLVEDYVVDKWDEVSVSQEFEQCCQEIAAGEWGTQGGQTLLTLFRRLRSPNNIP